ncbi:MAG TPA: hypothetical protein VGK47_11885, partial [Nitrososphaeraceae archaeon]
MNYNYYSPGLHNFICMKCHQKKKSDQLMIQWDNLIVCRNCYDPKHPWLEPTPVIDDLEIAHDTNSRSNPFYIDTTQEGGLSIWGQAYEIGTNLVPDIEWQDYNEFWGDGSGIPYTNEN